MEIRKKRRIWIATLFSLLVPGLGQLYNGQFVKALVLYGLVVVLGGFWRVALGHVVGAAFWALCAIVLYLVALIDAIVVCLRKKEIVLTRLTRWYVYLLVVLFNALVTLFMFSQPYKSYIIPAGSMIPSLQIGDRFIVDTTYYADHPLSRGDIIVVLYPDDPTRKFVKRIIGLPGETVQLIDKQVLVNGEILQEPYTQHIMKGILPQQESPRDNFGPVVVPTDAVFLLGDNRDSSLDSRFWKKTYATIDMITGKALYVYWAKDLGRIGSVLK